MAATYEHNGVSFVPAPDWIDRTVVAYDAPSGPGGASASFVMTRERLRDGDTLYTHAKRMLMESARREQDFELLESRETTQGDLPAVHIRARVTSPVGVIEQALTLVATQTPKGPMVTTFTALAPKDRAAALRPVFNEMLRSVRFDGPVPDRRSRPPSAPPMSDAYPLRGTAEFVPMPGVRQR